MASRSTVCAQNQVCGPVAYSLRSVRPRTVPDRTEAPARRPRQIHSQAVSCVYRVRVLFLFLFYAVLML